MIMSILGLIGTMAGEGIKGYFRRKQLEQQTKLAVAEGTLRLAQTQVEGVIQWNNTMAEASKDSWKDEFWTLVFGLPIGVLLIGVMGAAIVGAQETAQDMVEAVKLAIGAMDELPSWYLEVIGVLVAAAVGVERLVGAFKKVQKQRTVHRLAEQLPAPASPAVAALPPPVKPKDIEPPNWDSW